jgi:hypothetical protein
LEEIYNLLKNVVHPYNNGATTIKWPGEGRGMWLFAPYNAGVTTITFFYRERGCPAVRPLQRKDYNNFIKETEPVVGVVHPLQ